MRGTLNPAGRSSACSNPAVSSSPQFGRFGSRRGVRTNLEPNGEKSTRKKTW